MNSFMLDNLPDTWRLLQLSEICNIVSESCEPANANGLPYLGLEHLVSGFPAIHGIGDAKQVRSTKTRFTANDILYGKLRPYLRKAVLATFDGICSTDIIVLRVNDAVLPNFLVYLLHSDYFVNYAKATTSGVNHPRTSWNKLKHFKIPLPPLPEQRKIAALLSLVQKAIEQQEQLIALTTELKKALMHKLFTEGTRGESQKMTEIGPIPESWEVTKIGDVFKFSSGKTRPKDITPERNEEQNIPVYGGNGIMGYSKNALLDRQVLILGRVGEYCGCSHLTEQLCWVTDNALYSKEIKRPINLLFAKNYFEYLNLNKYSNKMGQPLITQGIIHNVKFGLPSATEQDDIAKILGTLDQKIKQEKQKRDLLQILFRTLLHQLMTGQIRVGDIELKILREENV